MKTVFGDQWRIKMHRLQQTFETNRYAQKRSFFEEHSYYPPCSASSEISANSNWTSDSESEVSASESYARSAEDEELHVDSTKGYLLLVVVAGTVVIFLFEIPLRLPYYHCLSFAVLSLHMMLTPVPSTKLPHYLTEDSDCQSMKSSEEEALYRRSADMSPATRRIPSITISFRDIMAGQKFENRPHFKQ